MEAYQDVFRDELPGLPPDNGIAHAIDTGDHAPISRAPFKMSPAELDELKKQLAELRKLGLIQPSSSSWGAPVLFVKKKDGSMRMCIDFRAINKVTIRDTYPLPRIGEYLERLGGARFFSKIDLKSGYHQVRIRPEDVPKTAFNTRYGSFEFLVLPFGLTNAPPTFQRLMNTVLEGFIDEFVLVYLDDILIYSKTEGEHERHVRQVLDRLRQQKLFANRKKCVFGTKELEFVGYHISAKGILPSRNKINSIQQWPQPTNVQEVRQFIGVANYYRQYIKGFASIAAPLTGLTRGQGTKLRPIVWNEECEKAFRNIKQQLTSAPVLLPPNPNRPWRIETDASDFGIGAVLSQTDSAGRWHPVAFESKKLSSAERNYPAQERELLAILHALRTWRCFIDGRQYEVYTDHNPLQYLRSKKDPAPRLVRWLNELELCDPTIKYKPGKENTIPDKLSRRQDLHDLSQSPPMDEDYLYLLDSSENLDWPLCYLKPSETYPANLRELLERDRDKFVIRGDTVLRRVIIDDEALEVPYLEWTKRADVIEEFHTGFGHQKGQTMQDMLRKRFWWPTMHKDIEVWLKHCLPCQMAAGSGRSIHQAPMISLDVPPPFSRWHLDFIRELPTTLRGNRWLLVAVDYTTNWPIARPLPDATGEAVAKFIYEEIVMRFGCPTEILTVEAPILCPKL
jgi:hypothetical protein